MAAGAPSLEGMKLVKGGSFLMGSDEHYPEEAPQRKKTVGDFWIDETPVSTAEFAKFVKATGYKTFAEFAPDPKDYPGMPPELAVAGSAVFVVPGRPVDLRNPGQWWDFVTGANWRFPLGPDGPEAEPDHPVVQIAYSDAEAYAKWAGKELPAEAEFEYAARGGMDGRAFAWGDELVPDGKYLANFWQGVFPNQNLALDGYERTSPVRSYPPNGYGLYDMIGNVWEWTCDWYSDSPPENSCCGGGVSEEQSYEPGFAELKVGRRVLKGGSHLCAENYCQRYRPAARHPQAIDSPTSHIGFRCVVRVSAD